MMSTRNPPLLNTLVFFLTVLASLNPGFGGASAQESSSPSSFQCGVVDDVNTKVLPDTDFATIETQYNMKNWGGDSNSDNHLMPKSTHWHIYAIPDGEVPRYSSIPEGFIIPEVSGSNLEFPAQKGVLKDLGYSKGDKIEAAVNLYIPVSQLRNIKVNGVDDYVEVIATEEWLLLDGEGDANSNSSSTVSPSSTSLPTINIRSSGVDSRLYVNTPYSKVRFTGSGVDTTAVISAASGSSVDLSGVDQSVSIKSDYLSSVTLSGIDQDMLIEGGTYGKISMSGIDGKVQVNGETGCNAVDSSGINNNCRVTDQTVTVPTLSCVAQSKVVQSCNGLSTGATVGISIAALVLIGFCFALCFYTCGCCRSRRGGGGLQEQQTTTTYYPDPSISSGDEKKQQQQQNDRPEQAMAASQGQEPSVIEAEVIEVEPMANHHDVALVHDPEAGTTGSGPNKNGY